MDSSEIKTSRRSFFFDSSEERMPSQDNEAQINPITASSQPVRDLFLRDEKEDTFEKQETPPTLFPLRERISLLQPQEEGKAPIPAKNVQGPQDEVKADNPEEGVSGNTSPKELARIVEEKGALSLRSAIIEKIITIYPRMLLVFTDKKCLPFVFTPFATKSGGCAVGTIYKKTTRNFEKTSLWIGKIGQPGGGYLIDQKASYQTYKKKEVDIDAIREKVASDIYEVLGNNFFHVPRTALSLQPIVNDFMQAQVPLCMFAIINNSAFTSSVRIMSRFVDGYTNFQQAKTRGIDGTTISLIEFLQTNHRPPTHLMTPEGEEVPLIGMMEMIAVGRILADTDVLGGRCDNAGFIWIKEGKKIIRAETYKIDPGCAFNFFHDERDSLPSTNWVINTHHQLADGKMLKNLKDLQVAQHYLPNTIFWESLLPEQKEIFLSILNHVSQYIQEKELIDFLFSRNGKLTEEFPEQVCYKLAEGMKQWILFQLKIYRDDLKSSSFSVHKKENMLAKLDDCFATSQEEEQLRLQSSNENTFQLLDENRDNIALEAVTVGNLSILQSLYERNPSLITETRKEEWTLLHLAADKQHIEIVDWILEQQPSLASSKPSGLTFIELAIFNERMAVVEHFKEKIQGDRPLILQIAKRSCHKVFSLLLESGLSPDLTSPKGQTLLHLAAESGDVDNCKLLLQKNASIDALDLSKRTPLYLATVQGHIDVVKFLLEEGANPMIQSEEGDTLLHVAAFFGHAHLLKMFLELPSLLAVIHSRDVDGKEPIHKAVWGEEKPEVIQVLLAKGANPNASNSYQYTPLHWAAKHGHQESARLLLEKGASVEAVNVNHDFPFDLAVKFEQKDFFHSFLGTQKKLLYPTKQETEQLLFQLLLQAKQRKLIEEQIYYLLKLSNCFMDKENFLEAANFTNRALLLVEQVKQPLFQSYLLAKLAEIENMQVQKLGLRPKVSALLRHREQMTLIRKEQERSLKQGESVVNILEVITKEMRRVVKTLLQQTESLLGPAPVKWTCLSLGAFGRKEIGPYSKIELAFLVEKTSDQVTAYFQKYEKILLQKFMSLGDSSRCLPKENDEFPQGSVLASPCKLGTPASFASFQDAKNDNLLLAELFHTAGYLAADKTLGKQYLKAKQKTEETRLSWSLTKNAQEVGLKIIDHYIKESAFEANRNFDLQRDVYHFFQGALNGLAMYFYLSGNSTFQWVNELFDKKIVSEEGRAHLKKAFTLIQTLKVKIEFFYKSHTKAICCSNQDPNFFFLSAEDRENLVEIVKVLFPFREALIQFSQSKDKKYLQNRFYNNACSHQSLILEKLR